MNYDEKSYTKDNYSRNRLRGLKQYKEMSDDEFNEFMDQKESGVEHIKDFEDRIQRKMDSFGEDYDLDDLKINDKLTLRNLAQAYIKLEDLETVSYKVMYESGGLDDVDVLRMDKINNMMSVLRKDISTMQNDLNITRKVRKGDENLSVISELERLKLKAKEFIEAKLQYVFCESCSELVGNFWVLYPEAKNKFSFTCKRKLANGEECGHVTTVYSKDVLENRGVNRPELVPEFYK
jgi:hypothetical protein